MFLLVDEYGLVRVCKRYTHKIFKEEKEWIKKNRKYISKILKYSQTNTREKLDTFDQQNTPTTQISKHTQA